MLETVVTSSVCEALGDNIRSRSFLVTAHLGAYDVYTNNEHGVFLLTPHRSPPSPLLHPGLSSDLNKTISPLRFHGSRLPVKLSRSSYNTSSTLWRHATLVALQSALRACADASLHANVVSAHSQCPHLVWAKAGLFVNSVFMYSQFSQVLMHQWKKVDRNQSILFLSNVYLDVF